MNQKSFWGGLATGLAIMALVWGIFSWTKRPLARLEKLDQTMAELGTSTAGKGPETPEVRLMRADAAGEHIKELMSLPAEERQVYMDKKDKDWRDRMAAKQEELLDELMSLPPAERVARLDKMIAEGKTIEGMAAAAAGPRMIMRTADSNTIGQLSAGSGGPNYGRTGDGNSGNVNNTRDRLNNMSPQGRAKMDEYRRMMNERQKGK